MSTLNRCDFIGRIGSDPLCEVVGNSEVARFSLAIETHYNDRDGHKRKHTEWVDCIAWNKMAKVVKKFVRKGAKVYLSGRLETSRWIDNTGTKRRKTNVVTGYLIFLEGAGARRGKRGEAQEEIGSEEQDAAAEDESPPF